MRKIRVQRRAWVHLGVLQVEDKTCATHTLGSTSIVQCAGVNAAQDQSDKFTAMGLKHAIAQLTASLEGKCNRKTT